MRREAVDSSAWHEHTVGAKVMTKEGYPGTVTAVEDGPQAGNEEYIVTLDDGKGGGRYGPGELRPLSARTAAVQAFAPATAAADYPELHDLLATKPPPPHAISMEDYLSGLATGGDTLYNLSASLTKQATDGGDHDHSAMVALSIPPEVAHKAAVDGGLPPEQMHVTLAYLPHPTPDELAKAHEIAEQHAGKLPSINASVGGTGQFEAGEDGVPHYAPIDGGDAVHALQGSLVTALEAAGVNVAHDHEFTPHMTRTYLPEGEPAPAPVEPTKFKIPSLVVAQGDDWRHYPFGGRDDETEAVEDLQDLHGSKAEQHTAGWIWDTIRGKPSGEYVNFDWCKFRHNQHCNLPHMLNPQATIAQGSQVWNITDRGFCPRDWEHQTVCPLGSPGPNAERMATRQAAAQGLTLHLLPPDAEAAHQILQAEIGASGPAQDPHEAVLHPNELVDAIHRSGGFSVKDHTGDGPTSGYMVSKNKSSERAYPENGFGAQHIQSYLDEHQPELAAPNAYFGAWHDPETKKVYLDVSHHYPDFEQAKAVGKNAQQLGIYDLGSGKTIYLQAGLRKAFFTPDADVHDVLDFLGIEPTE